MVALRSQLHATRDELGWLFAHARAPRIRTMRQFAEQEVIIPDGKWAGHRFRCDRQPFVAHWFDLVDSGRWRRRFATGCTQSGKTLCALVIPILYHLFERGEGVGVGLPSDDMAGDKWREDLLPAILASRYARLLPKTGLGARGAAKVPHVRFANGVTLKFFGAGGGDKKRAGYTTRVMVMTEIDGYDAAGEASREADKVSQLEARTLSFGDQAIVYGECTVSVESGRIWSEVQGGTATRLVLPCPHCRAFVTPEREHLLGWEGAETEIEAGERASFHCPACGEAWSDDERRTANHAARVLHRGQSIDPAGQVTGEPPRTETLGFRWSAVNNLFWPSSLLGSKEWKAARAADEENAKKEVLQFYWALPYKPPTVAQVVLDAATLQRRTDRLPRGQVPPGTKFLTVGVDVGKWLCHWVARAWLDPPHLRRSVTIDYGRFDVPAAELPPDQAILAALRTFRDGLLATGWAAAQPGDPTTPLQVWIDSGYYSDPVYDFCRESGPVFRATKGWSSDEFPSAYSSPANPTKATPFIGERYHFAWLEAKAAWLVHVDSDWWKTQTQAAYAIAADAPGADILFAAARNEHLAYAKHLTSEQSVEEFVAGKGNRRRWEKRGANHWLDAAALGRAAGHLCGARRDPPPQESGGRAEKPAPQDGANLLQMLGEDRPFLVTER